MTFQSTLRRTERRARSVVAELDKLISIHAPTNGATPVVLLVEVVADISIHAPTNGATRMHIFNICKQQISIHAPTNGATTAIKTISKALPISIHAPTNGATFLTLRLRLRSSYFNPRSDERSDLARRYLFLTGRQNFNPRSDERSDERYTDPLTEKVKFQSTLRRTERRSLTSPQTLQANFNPRSDERSDRG